MSTTRASRGSSCAGAGTCEADCTCTSPTTTTTSLSATTTTSSTTIPATCNPLAAPGAQGCANDDKCTWITVADMPTRFGTLGCAPNGTTFWWTRESADSVTAFSNTVGWCFKFAAFQYDSNGDMTLDAPYPRCPTLTTGDVVPPINGTSDALYFGCVELPASLVAPLPSAPRVLLDRVDGWR